MNEKKKVLIKSFKVSWLCSEVKRNSISNKKNTSEYGAKTPGKPSEWNGLANEWREMYTHQKKNPVESGKKYMRFSMVNVWN